MYWRHIPHWRTMHHHDFRLITHPKRLSLIASCSYDGDVRLWDLSTRKCLVSFAGHDGKFARDLCFTPSTGHRWEFIIINGGKFEIQTKFATAPDCSPWATTARFGYGTQRTSWSPRARLGRRWTPSSPRAHSPASHITGR